MCGNYSREETIQGRKLFKGGNYIKKYGRSNQKKHGNYHIRSRELEDK